MGILGALPALSLQVNPPQPLDLASVLQSAAHIQGSRTQNATALFNLEEARRQREVQQVLREVLRQHPEVLFGEGGMPGAVPGPPGGAPAGGAAAPLSPGLLPAGPLTETVTRRGGVPPVPFGRSQWEGPLPQVVPAPDPTQPARLVPQPVTTTQTIPGPAGAGGPASPPAAPAGPSPTTGFQWAGLARQNPEAAMALMDLQSKAQERRQQVQANLLTGQLRLAEFVGREVQGITSQEELERVRGRLRQLVPQAAELLPQYYTEAGMQAVRERAQSVADNAKTKLTQAQTRAAEAMLGQQGLSQGVRDELAIMRQNGEPPNLETAKQRAQDKAMAYAREGEKEKGRVEAELRGEKTIAEALGERAVNLYDTTKGTAIPATTRVRDYEALPPGRAKLLSNTQREGMEKLNAAVPIIERLQQHIDRIYGPGGVFSHLTPEERRVVNAIDPWKAGNVWDQLTQKYPELSAAQSFIEGNAASLARALAGETGAMNESDIERAKALMPNLKSALTLWPPSQIGVLLPDTRAKALRNMNDLVDMVNARGRTVLENEAYQHPRLHRYDTAQDIQERARRAPQPTTPGRQSAVEPGVRTASVPATMSLQDVQDAMAQTGRSRAEVEAAARRLGIRVYGSNLAVPSIVA